MNVEPTDLPGVVVVNLFAYGDTRGWFMESWNGPRFDAALAELGLPAPRPFLQDNHSCSKAGVVRGLHYQLPPHPQGKLVRVVKGAVYDVVVDIRRGSPTFGRHFGIELSADNRRQLWIPEGFAHGFLALEDDTHFVYKTTDVYSRPCERTIRWDDPELGIPWPLHRLKSAPIVGPKDADARTMREMEQELPTV